MVASAATAGVSMDDPASQLLVELDKFGVTVIDFGYVALFIVLYILIVGPLDFFLLKYVFKRLEWTWITFPAVVLAVSVLAYFAAYALKGKDLKINKVDIVDFDLRTSREQPRVYGHSFFTILSPRIQNYTVGRLEPEESEVLGGAESEKAAQRRSDEAVDGSRPSGGFNGMDRGGSGGFFRNAYHYARDTDANGGGNISGLRGVPIPVWTTKAFMASWGGNRSPRPPRSGNRSHLAPRGQGSAKSAASLKTISASISSMPGLFSASGFYPLEGGLKSVKKGAAAAPIRLLAQANETVDKWVFRNDVLDDVPGDAAANSQQTSLA